MVIDTSALFAIETEEPEARRLDSAIRSADRSLISTASAVELAVVLTRRRQSDQRSSVEDLLAHYRLSLVGVEEAHMRAAWEGFIRFGKGRHSACLNFGDCFSYALARSLNLPLLFKGDDFGRTDVAVAPW